jgi:hypothetical protein
VKNFFIFFTVFYFLHRFQLCTIFIYFFSLFFSVKKAFQKTNVLVSHLWQQIVHGFVHEIVRTDSPQQDVKLAFFSSAVVVEPDIKRRRLTEASSKLSMMSDADDGHRFIEQGRDSPMFKNYS